MSKEDSLSFIKVREDGSPKLTRSVGKEERGLGEAAKGKSEEKNELQA